MSRDEVLTDAQWLRIEPLLPSSVGKQSRPFRDHRQVLEGIVFRYRTGCPWRELPERFGPWQTGRGNGTPVQPGRHLGPGAGATARPGRRGRADRLAAVGGLHDQPGAPARSVATPGGRGDPAVAHRGLGRTRCLVVLADGADPVSLAQVASVGEMPSSFSLSSLLFTAADSFGSVFATRSHSASDR